MVILLAPWGLPYSACHRFLTLAPCINQACFPTIIPKADGTAWLPVGARQAPVETQDDPVLCSAMSQNATLQIPALPLSGCVTFTKLLDLSVQAGD